MKLCEVDSVAIKLIVDDVEYYLLRSDERTSFIPVSIPCIQTLKAERYEVVPPILSDPSLRSMMRARRSFPAVVESLSASDRHLTETTSRKKEDDYYPDTGLSIYEGCYRHNLFR